MISESLNNAVPLASGGDIAALGVYHDIHCLRRILLFSHKECYHRDLTPTNINYLKVHVGHCTESLRRSVMCNADPTLVTFM